MKDTAPLKKTLAQWETLRPYWNDKFSHHVDKTCLAPLLEQTGLLEDQHTEIYDFIARTERQLEQLLNQT